MSNSKKAIYYPRQDAQVGFYYDNASKKIAVLAPKYGTSADLLVKFQEYNTQIPLLKLKSDTDQQTAKASVKVKDNLFAEAKVDMMRELRRITDLPNFDEADAMDLGIRKENVAEDMNGVEAVISAMTVLPQQVVIDWVKGKMDGVIIYASADGTNFEEIGTDLRSPFEDRRPNQTAGQPEVRHYRLRYLKNDQEVGQYSKVSSATVLI